MGSGRSLVFVAAAALGSGFLGCRDSELPPYGEAVLEVDTDAPVPSLANRLRVDVYREDGTWIESRDIARLDPRDWPVSFGVFSSDESKSSKVLVRLRAYAEGAVRDYTGERGPPLPFVERKIATDLASLCRDAPRLEPGKSEITQRRGKDPLTLTPKCKKPVSTGSTAVKLTVPVEDDYRIKVVSGLPERGTLRIVPTQWSIVVRKTCEDPSTELDCVERTPVLAGAKPQEGDDPDPQLDVHLLPGEYTVLTAGAGELQPADLTLRVKRLAEWDSPRELEPAVVAETPLKVTADFTPPTTEPEPTSTIERLVAITLTPGEVQRMRIDLHGECFGRPSDLAIKDGLVSIASAKTCIDGDVLTNVVVEAPRQDKSEPSKAGSFGKAEPCESEWPRDGLACIPGGTFSFGGPDFRGLEESSSIPPHVARMPRFWLDQYEVSVARWRAAVGRGFVSPDPRSPFVNDGDLGKDIPAEEGAPQRVNCTWSTTPRDREDLPVLCVSWYSARALCQFEGGDLPTEAEWEYAASAAGRPTKEPYPWGVSTSAPGCDEATYGRSTVLELGGGGCRDLGFRPSPVTAPGRSDVTALTKVYGLAGNANEWVLDSAQPLSSPCWRNASVTSPRCWEENALLRSVRGGSWLGIPDTLRPMFRTRLDPGKIHDATSGFRCAYARAPR